jgi:hypothetical protein
MNACVLAGRALAIRAAMPQASPVSVRLVDMRGRAHTLQSADHARDLVFDMKRIPAGTYTVEVQAADALMTQRIVIAK